MLISTRRPFVAAVTAIALVSLIAAQAAAHDLPVGDGHVTSHPARGNVYACSSRFRGRGAQHTGAWFHGKTWDPAEKPHVRGRVMWPQARLHMTQIGSEIRVRGNDLPVHEPTGIFPISRSDPAYRYDRNPNSIRAQRLNFEIPAHPTRASRPSCLPMGPVAITVTGVLIFDAVDDGGRDAAAHEIQDRCDGHPQQNGEYHYHSSSPCLPGARSNKVVGWALDGFPILGMRDARGRLLTNADLDACHGRDETVKVDGRTYHYAYRLTEEYPYTLGCFAGRVQRATQEALRRSMGPRRGRGPQRPPRRPLWGPPPQ